MCRKNIELASSGRYSKENRYAVTICCLSLIIVGILMILSGGFISYVYFTEVTPPNYEAYYQRYVGSGFPRILGILMLMVGLILFWGSSMFLVHAHYYSKEIRFTNVKS